MKRVFHRILSCRFDWTELGNHAFNMLKEPHNVFYFTKRFKAADNRPENALTLCIWILRIFFGFNEAWNEKYCCSSGTTPDAWVEYHGNILSNIYLCIPYYLKEIFSSIKLNMCQFKQNFIFLHLLDRIYFILILILLRIIMHPIFNDIFINRK